MPNTEFVLILPSMGSTEKSVEFRTAVEKCYTQCMVAHMYHKIPSKFNWIYELKYSVYYMKDMYLGLGVDTREFSAMMEFVYKSKETFDTVKCQYNDFFAYLTRIVYYAKSLRPDSVTDEKTRYIKENKVHALLPISIDYNEIYNMFETLGVLKYKISHFKKFSAFEPELEKLSWDYCREKLSEIIFKYINSEEEITRHDISIAITEFAHLIMTYIGPTHKVFDDEGEEIYPMPTFCDPSYDPFHFTNSTITYLKQNRRSYKRLIDLSEITNNNIQKWSIKMLGNSRREIPVYMIWE